MRIEKTVEFEKDIRRLDNDMRKRLKKTIQKIMKYPESGKPLRHVAHVFSERISNFRLIYQFKNNKILLVCFKNREQVYKYLKQ